MKHLKALVIKFVMSAVVLGIVLTGIYNYDFSDSMLISLILTVVAYALGDLLVYRNAADDSDYKKRNIIATISDLILSFLVIWIMGASLLGNTSTIIQSSIVSVIVITMGEWFFHKYLDKHVLNTDNYRETDTTYNK
ncbi:YndM family protein (plasmid) [Priestia aryabhattai]|uniref:YndM family protein n=1 Tax=Priestia aryabhattai TaxID=412384 RepID=UPI002452CB39|nr:YndM family protein [Priestia aryabhattai]MDH3135406.1 YndM family protein [Priestia aryabhattai]